MSVALYPDSLINGRHLTRSPAQKRPLSSISGTALEGRQPRGPNMNAALCTKRFKAKRTAPRTDFSDEVASVHASPDTKYVTPMHSTPRLFARGTQGAKAWEACGGMILGFLKKDCMMALMSNFKDVQRSFAAWARVALEAADIPWTLKAKCLPLLLPNWTQALQTWASGGFRSALVCAPGHALEKELQYLRIRVYRMLYDAAHAPAGTDLWIQHEHEAGAVHRRHCNIRAKYVPVVCDWLIQVHTELFGTCNRVILHCDSPFAPIQRSIKYLHLYLSRCTTVVRTSTLQLVAVSCYNVALEDTYGARELKRRRIDPGVLSRYTKNTYTPRQVRSTSQNIRRVIQTIQNKFKAQFGPLFPKWMMVKGSRVKVGYPTTPLTPMGWVRHLLLNPKERLSSFEQLLMLNLMDLSMYDTYFADKAPCKVAAMAIMYACKLDAVGVDITEVLTRAGLYNTTLEYAQESYFDHPMLQHMSNLYRDTNSQERVTRDINCGAEMEHYSTNVMPQKSMIAGYYWYRYTLLNNAF